jgi:formylglycine-generating enzyme required for sulfatase activity
MARHEVTLAEFRRFVEQTGYRTEAEVQDGCHGWEGRGEIKRREFTWKYPGFIQENNHPVVCVSWNDSLKYIEWINSVSGRQYRLPTEAEWEYAARSRGRDLQYAWGKGTPSGNIADSTAFRKLLGASPATAYDDGYAFTAPAGSFSPSELGLYDMSGNVYEWVGDWYGEDYYDNSPRYNPGGPSEGAFKIMRGGSWNPLPELVTTTTRRWNVAGARGAWIGFRLVHPGNVSP